LSFPNVAGGTLKGPQFLNVSDEKCQKIHDASLEILERVGVRLFFDDAVDLLAKAGAEVSDGNLVRIGHQQVETALKTVPRSVVLHDRLGNPVMPLDGARSYYGPGSDCLNMLDFRTGERRKPVRQDLMDGVSLCDALPNVDFLMSMVLPTDVDATLADRYQMEAMLTYSTKPIIFVTYEFAGCADAVKMAEAVAGSAEALREKPFVACYINAVSGLRHNKEALEKLMFLAEKNLPSLYIPCSTAGISSPVTPAGAVALDYAGVLLGLVISQLVREGAPVVVPGLPQGTFDMRTMVTSYCEPERILPQAMAHFYGLPMFAIGGVSEAKLGDQQAAAEAAMSLVVETFSGSHIIHDLGYLESGLTFSFVQLVLCNEIVSWIKAYSKEIEVTDESLALDVIAKLGPDGDFLTTDHTLSHYSERWYPKLFERANYQTWVERDGESFSVRAQYHINELLAGHKVEPLPNNATEQIKNILLNI
jgi:trimethylamine--corrinoid protein Co-methyltransferase